MDLQLYLCCNQENQILLELESSGKEIIGYPLVQDKHWCGIGIKECWLEFELKWDQEFFFGPMESESE